MQTVHFQPDSNGQSLAAVFGVKEFGSVEEENSLSICSGGRDSGADFTDSLA